ncbi:MAG: SpoIIE family protein phosphatase [Crocinitomicaceae bacterium]|nr:SpoIIE family protein phosphatase [Crocinitomicaceae bacterium]
MSDSFILYKPKDIVAGDFYWLEKSSDQILIAACDCTGHGVPGAMVSVICNNALNRSVREFGLKEPGKILDKTREIVIAEFEKSEDEVKDGMDISLCSLSLSALTLYWSGANNPLWILRKDSSVIEEIKADKQPIGKYEAAKSFTTHQKKLDKGDQIYLITDGYQDQFGGDKGKKFKAAELKNLLISISKETMESQKKRLMKLSRTGKESSSRIDDVCIIGIRV